jgi:uncharacterized RDD family membrane protein YckC
MRYAGFWKRFNAYGYDVLIVQAIALVPVLLFTHFPTLEQVVTMAPEADAWFDGFTNVSLVVSALYNILMIAGPRQATWGKRHCGLKVVNIDGSRLTLPQSALRHAASGLSMIMGGLGFLPIFFTAEKTALHDMLCKTRVVRVMESAQ